MNQACLALEIAPVVDMTARCVDWFRVLVDIERTGVSLHGVARDIGIPRETIRGWRSGQHPRHHDGETLIAYWSTRTGKPRGELPMAGFGDWRSLHSPRPRRRIG